MSTRDNRGIEPRDEYYKKVEPLLYNPYENLIDAYVNDAPMGTSPHPDTFKIERWKKRHEKRWRAVAPSDVNRLKELVNGGYVFSAHHEGDLNINMQRYLGNHTVPQEFRLRYPSGWLFLYSWRTEYDPDHYNKVLDRFPFGDLPTNQQQIGYSRKPIYNEETGEISYDMEQISPYGNYYNFQPGWSMVFAGTVAFLSPEFYIFDKVNTYKLWAQGNRFKGYIVLYPNNNVVPNLIDFLGMEQWRLRFKHSILWTMKPNIAFENDALFEQVPEPDLPRYEKINGRLVCESIDDLPWNFHPNSGNFTDQAGMVDTAIAGFLRTFWLTRSIIRAVTPPSPPSAPIITTLGREQWSRGRSFDYISGDRVSVIGGFTQGTPWHPVDRGHLTGRPVYDFFEPENWE